MIKSHKKHSILVLIGNDVTHVLVINIRHYVRIHQLLRIAFDKIAAKNWPYLLLPLIYFTSGRSS